MSTEHKLRTTLSHGDPDIGAEIDVEIIFNYTSGRPAVMYLRNGDPGYPADPDEIEFIKVTPLCNGKPSPFVGAFADLQQESLNDLAHNWLESEDGVSEAMSAVDADMDSAREYAAELRAERF